MIAFEIILKFQVYCFSIRTQNKTCFLKVRLIERTKMIQGKFLRCILDSLSGVCLHMSFPPTDSVCSAGRGVSHCHSQAVRQGIPP